MRGCDEGAGARGPGGHGFLDGAAELDTKVLMVITFDLAEYVCEPMRGGASGFLLKDAPSEEFSNATRVIAAGEALLAPRITTRLIVGSARRLSSTAPPSHC